MANPIMVPGSHENESGSNVNNDDKEHDFTVTRNNKDSSNGTQTPAVGSSSNRLSVTSKMLVDSALRPCTKKKYTSIKNKWIAHCRRLGLDPMAQDTIVFLNFMAEGYEKKLRWGTLRSYVPALRPFLKHVDIYQVRQLLRGVFNNRPPVAKYMVVWDVNMVLAFMSCFIVDEFKDKCMRLATLFMLLSGNRVNMLSHFNIDHMYINNEELTFTFDEALNIQTRRLLLNL